MPTPSDNIGKICRSLEQYWDTAEGRMKVKARPVLVIGHENNYQSAFNVDYELLPISKVGNFPSDRTFDILIDGDKRSRLGLNQDSYIRTHKITWTNVKRIDLNPVGDLKSTYPELFNQLLELNHQWITERNNASKVQITSAN